MNAIYAFPARYMATFLKGQAARRAQLAAGDPDDLSALYARIHAERAERDRLAKIRSTMNIARRLRAGEDIPTRWPSRRQAWR